MSRADLKNTIQVQSGYLCLIMSHSDEIMKIMTYVYQFRPLEWALFWGLAYTLLISLFSVFL